MKKEYLVSNWIESIILEKLQGEKEMKNKLNASNLMNTYYDNGLYELLFDAEGKEIFVRNIKAEDHPNAATDEWYFDSNEIIEEIIKNVEDEDIEIKENNMTNYGKVTYEGKEYILIQQAYIAGTNEEPYYLATAIDNEGNEYEVEWELNEDAGLVEDESTACDWDRPVDVREI